MQNDYTFFLKEHFSNVYFFGVSAISNISFC